MSIWIPSGISRRMNRGAFGGNLNCPVCRSTALRFLETLNITRIRYRCRKCGITFQYETGRDMTSHPYAPLKKKKWQRIVDAARGERKGERR